MVGGTAKYQQNKQQACQLRYKEEAQQGEEKVSLVVLWRQHRLKGKPSTSKDLLH